MVPKTRMRGEALVVQLLAAEGQLEDADLGDERGILDEAHHEDDGGRQDTGQDCGMITW